MKQYAAKLLFQWRPVKNGVSRKRRVCEERIVIFPAKSDGVALLKAKKLGHKGQFVEQKNNGAVHFEFVGVLELKDITLGYSEGEVWYEILEMKQPMERRRKIIPKETTLDALRKTVSPTRGRLGYDWPKRR